MPDSAPRSEPQMPDSRERSRAQPGPVDLRRVDGDQPQRRGVPGQDAGHPARPSPCRPRCAAATGTSPARASSGATSRGRACDRRPDELAQSTIVPARPAGVPEERSRRAARRPGCRRPPAAAGRSGSRRRRTTPSCRCRASAAYDRIQAARDSPTSGDEARWPVHTPRSSTARSAASMWSKSGRSGRVSGRIAPVISTVRWPAARCSRIRRTAAGDSRDRTWSVRCSSATASRSASRAPSYSR